MVRTEVQGDGKAALDRRQPLDQVVGHAREQEIVAGGVGRDAIAPPHQQRAVEDVVLGGQRFRHTGACSPASSHQLAAASARRWIPDLSLLGAGKHR